MKPYDQNIVTFEAMFLGYTEATKRFEKAASGRDPTMTYAAVFEALNWAVALDDRTAAHFAPEGKPLGLDWRPRIHDAEIVAGVRYARNSAHHQWSDAFSLRDGGMTFPMTFPVTFGHDWIWRPADDLPPPDQAPHPEAERVYRERMEGKSVRSCLTVLSLVFKNLQHMLEPHTIRSTTRPFDEYPFPAGEEGIPPSSP